VNVATADDMRALGRALGNALRAASGGALVIGLEGELGAGKTTLVGGILAGLGVAGAIRSPTYTLIEPYEAAGLQLYHIDLYRLSGAREVEALGIRDLLTDRAVLLIEWPSRAAGALPTADLSVSIEYQGSGRLLGAQAHSSVGDKLLEQILAATSE
jgi:tRNA threonylcarbamoyladenosine biosynthesis protein TsaE